MSSVRSSSFDMKLRRMRLPSARPIRLARRASERSRRAAGPVGFRRPTTCRPLRHAGRTRPKHVRNSGARCCSRSSRKNSRPRRPPQQRVSDRPLPRDDARGHVVPAIPDRPLPRDGIASHTTRRTPPGPLPRVAFVVSERSYRAAAGRRSASTVPGERRCRRWRRRRPGPKEHRRRWHRERAAPCEPAGTVPGRSLPHRGGRHG